MLFCFYAYLKPHKWIVSSRDWSPKFATGVYMIISCNSKSIWVIKLYFCWNNSLMGESFWQNNSPVTHKIFELQPLSYLSQSQILVISLYLLSWHDLRTCSSMSLLSSDPSPGIGEGEAVVLFTLAALARPG